ncbi:hypothetical protein EVAR_57225_1 [Eumeta japonica]|uniref:Uncharacterized protein n=1 Tax=Eumeta variegata TaxID=151549 RepID=A0A4C1YM92_EUMVA|nr:hypothetical protein EVAR_57225_1 [Eumeta japonica]
MDIRNPREVTSALPATWAVIGHLRANGGGSGPQKMCAQKYRYSCGLSRLRAVNDRTRGFKPLETRTKATMCAAMYTYRDIDCGEIEDKRDVSMNSGCEMEEKIGKSQRLLTSHRGCSFSTKAMGTNAGWHYWDGSLDNNIYYTLESCPVWEKQSIASNDDRSKSWDFSLLVIVLKIFGGDQS